MDTTVERLKVGTRSSLVLTESTMMNRTPLFG